MKRCVYRAQCKSECEEEVLRFLKNKTEKIKGFIDNEEIMTLSIFKWKHTLFIYYECMNKIIKPEEIFGDLCGLLEKWPGEDQLRYWVPMMDIYHCCEPINTQYWQRKEPVKRVYAMVNRLRPEMVSSYIFYHYQYQEEKPGDWAKYASIHMYENLMFFYLEEPDGPDKPPFQGKLDTSNTPEQWQELMDKHFYPWEDEHCLDKTWREIELILYK